MDTDNNSTLEESMVEEYWDGDIPIAVSSHTESFDILTDYSLHLLFMTLFYNKDLDDPVSDVSINPNTVIS